MRICIILFATNLTALRELLEKTRRVLGLDNCGTLVMSANLASALSRQGNHAEAMEMKRKNLVSTTHLFGAEHNRMLISAINLAISLPKCDLKVQPRHGV